MEDLMQYYFETLLLLIPAQPLPPYAYTCCVWVHSYCYCEHYCSAASKYYVSI